MAEYMERLEIRLPEKLKKEFQTEIEKGGYNQSAVIRKLIESWLNEKSKEQN